MSKRARDRGEEAPTDSTVSGELDAGLDPRTPRSRPEPEPRVRHVTNRATLRCPSYFLFEF